MKQTILGQRLRQERASQGHTQKSLAYIAKVQPSTISRIELGYTCPMFVSLGVVQGLAKALNVTVDYLVGHRVAPDIGKRPMSRNAFELSAIYQGLSTTSKQAMLGYAKYLQSIEKRGAKIWD